MGGKMPAHLASGRHRVVVDIGMTVQSRKELLYAHFTNCHHKGLVAVVSGSEVTIFKCLSKCELGDFLAVAKYPELCFTGKYLPASQQTAFPADGGDLVIV